MGFVYISYIIFFPFVILYVGIRLMFVIYDLYDYYYFLSYDKKFDDYIIKKKKIEIRNKKIRKKIDKVKYFFNQKFKKMYISFKNKVKKFYNYLKKVVLAIYK